MIVEFREEEREREGSVEEPPSRGVKRELAEKELPWVRLGS